MSLLKYYIYSILTVIPEYAELENKKHKIPSKNCLELAKMPHDKLIAKLDTCIQSIPSSSRRHSFLKYILALISDLKPLVDQQRALTDEEEKTIREQLLYLLKNCYLLLDYSASKTYTVSYKEEQFVIYGFSNGNIKLALEHTFLNESAMLPVQSKPGDKEFKNLELILKQQIQAHQSPLKLQNQVALLHASNAQLTSESEARFREQQEKIALLTKENKQLSEELTNAKTECEILKIELAKRRNQIVDSPIFHRGITMFHHLRPSASSGDLVSLVGGNPQTPPSFQT